jgi:monoamine oxidase
MIMTDKHTMLFQISEGLKDALGTYAQKNNMPASEVARQAIAQFIKYDLAADPIPMGRPRRYANKEERLAAQRKERADNKAILQALLDAHAREQRQKDANSLREWLERKGVSVAV